MGVGEKKRGCKGLERQSGSEFCVFVKEEGQDLRHEMIFWIFFSRGGEFCGVLKEGSDVFCMSSFLRIVLSCVRIRFCFSVIFRYSSFFWIVVLFFRSGA